MTTPKIVLIGHVCIDHNRSEATTYTGWGSSVLYMAQYVQRAYGVEPTVISSYGPDMLKYLPDVTLLPKEPSHHKTLMYENDSRTGKRVQRVHNLQFAEPPEITPEVLAAVKAADIVVVATLLANYSAAYIRELLGHAKASSLKVLCPQGYFRHVTAEGLVVPRDFDEALDIVPQFDLVMYSEEDYPRAFELAKAWKQSVDNEDTEVIVTQSSRGASIVGKNDVVHIPTKPIPLEEIVDSVGCGDTFAATVTYAYYQTKDLEEAIRQAHHAAANKLLAVSVVPAAVS